MIAHLRKLIQYTRHCEFMRRINFLTLIHLFFWFSISLILLTSCQKDKNPFKSDEPAPLPRDRLLTDEELYTQEDPKAPAEKDEWIAWIEENHIPIRSLYCDDFTDLQFLKPLLQNKRIVQLGESGHGVAQFNQAKVRLIKFLHQKCGFDIIAFESSIFECFYVNEHMDSLTACEAMRISIFSLWHTWEVEPLFQYIKGCLNTNNSLKLAGFDIQAGSIKGVGHRPNFFKNVISRIDPEYAKTVYQLDSTFISKYGDEFNTYLEINEADLIEGYESISNYFNQHMDELQQAHPDHPGIPLVAKQTALSIVQYIHGKTSEDNKSGSEIRDKGMADNIDFLLDALYPGHKIIVWAHNCHIRHANNSIIIPEYPITWVNTNCPFQNMGSWLAQRYRPELYTIGLYMYRGQAAGNSRDVYDIEPATSGSLESIFYRARKMYCYVDLYNETRNNGNSWMFENINAKAWGSYPLKMVLKDQYDGIIFIDTVTPPDYIEAY